MSSWFVWAERHTTGPGMEKISLWMPPSEKILISLSEVATAIQSSPIARAYHLGVQVREFKSEMNTRNSQVISLKKAILIIKFTFGSSLNELWTTVWYVFTPYSKIKQRVPLSCDRTLSMTWHKSFDLPVINSLIYKFVLLMFMFWGILHTCILYIFKE